MNEERIDAEVAGLLAGALPDVDMDWQERAVAAVTAAQHAPRRPMRRTVAVAASIVVMLIGLGFVPMPLGKAPGALDRAIAAARQATTVHAVTRTWGKWGESGSEEWLSDDGFLRQETSRNGQVDEGVELVEGGWQLTVGPQEAWETFDPTGLQPEPLYDRTYLDRMLEMVRASARFRKQPMPDIQLTERREATLWGGTVDVVRARWTSRDDQWPGLGGFYENGTRVLMTAEIDPESGHLLSVREYGLRGGRWQQTYGATYEWNVEIPEELKTVQLPAGIQLHRFTWWETRADQVLAQADTRDWTVTLLSVDVNRNGDVLLSLSRVITADSQMPLVYNLAPPLVVEATGSGGEEYTQQDGYTCSTTRRSGYWTTTLKPADPESRPRRLTLTIWPYRESPSEDQSVTFRNIPLPPRQAVDDVMAEAREVIQY